jgi:ribonuclease P protein component
MLPAKFRLPAKEIPTIARRGKKLTHEYLDVRVWFDDTLPSPLFAVSVGLKASKLAVVRNDIKRRLRAAIVEIMQEKQVRPGKYLVVAKSDKLTEVDCKQILINLL